MTTADARSSTALREELATLVTALWYDIDHGDGAGASRYFTPDAELRHEDATFRGTAEIDAAYRARAARGPRTARHVASNLHLVEVGERSVRAVSTLVLFADDGEAPRPATTPALIADVWDRFELRDGAWLIGARWIRHAFVAPTTDLALPVGEVQR
jgi:hypothetical protein